MDYQIIVSIITAITAVAVAVIGYFLNERAKRKSAAAIMDRYGA